MADLSAAIAGLREATLAHSAADSEMAELLAGVRLREAAKTAIAALDAAQPVVEFMGRRLTSEKTIECWGVMLCDFMQDPPRGTKLYAAPQAPPAAAAAVPEGMVMVQCADLAALEATDFGRWGWSVRADLAARRLRDGLLAANKENGND